MSQISNLVASAQADVLGALADNGYLRLYAGAMPASADAPLGGATLLAELRLNADAFPPAVNGVLTANPVTDDSAADATGTATFFRVLKADGVTVLWQGTVGTAAPADLVGSSTSVQAGVNARVTSLTYTVQKG